MISASSLFLGESNISNMSLQRVLVIFILVYIYLFNEAIGQNGITTKLVSISEGFAESHVNAVIFRRNSISSYKDHQYVAFYDGEANVILAKRKLESSVWEIHKTQYKGNVKDAHNSISIMHDGDGFLHMSWDHHNNTLRYAVSLTPENIKIGEKKSMIGSTENKTTYPEFYKLKTGDLIFLYRDGSSGNGNLVMNHYDLKNKMWKRVQSNLIDGEGERNAYWQMCIDELGTMHLSWVWRETGNVATNHDICYAQSIDNGKSWKKSTGETYDLPINEKNAEYVMRIPQNSNLINTTSITADGSGNPFISTYFKSATDQATQFKVLFKQDGEWKSSTVSKRKSDFVLGGGGTRSVPISRPQILIQQKNDQKLIHVIYRDEEFGNKICLATANAAGDMDWDIQTLNNLSMSRWEPSYDTELWRNYSLLHIYHQVTHQGNADVLIDSAPTQVGVLEVSFE